MVAREPGRQALALAITIALLSISQMPAQAQEAEKQPSGTSAEEQVIALSGITVTAQKREEQLQDVPIAITVLPRQLLRDTGVHDIKDMQILTPGLIVTSSATESQTTARIRGIGTVGDNPGLESSVGVVIDGVYRPRNGVAFGDLGELERIEVLKGPQGTVFGKNTSAGLINVTTRRPTRDLSVEGELTIGNYGAAGAAATLNTPVGGIGAFRLYAVERDRDGFGDVRTGAGPRTSTDDQEQNMHSFRGQFLLEPNADLNVNFIADFTSRNEQCCAAETIVRGPTSAIINALAGGEGVIPVVDPYRRIAYSNRDTTTDVKDRGVSAEVNWNTPWFNNATLTSITSYRNWATINGADLDYTTADIWYRNPDIDQASTRFKTWTQEFRLTGSSERFDWMAGFFHSNEDLERHDQVFLGSAYEPYLSIAVLSRIAAAFPAGVVNTANAATFFSQAVGRPFGTTFVGEGEHDTHNQTAKSNALFTNDTFHIREGLDLTVGLRYTSEDKSLHSIYTDPNGALGCAAAVANPAAVGAALAARGVPVAALASLVPTVIGNMCLPWSNPLHNGRDTHQERDEHEWSGTGKLAYRWNDHLMTYLSAARGYKAGGFNLDRTQSSNGTQTGGSGIVPIDDTSFPAEFVNSYELGAKTTWLEGNLLLNAALFDQRYEDFQLNSFLGTSFVVRSIPEVTSRGVDLDLLWQTSIRGLMFQGGVTYADTKYGDDLLVDADLFKLPGSQVGFAPKWSTSAAVTYEWAFGENLIGRFNLGAKHLSEYNTGSDLDPEKQQDGYTVANARLGFGSRSRSWLLELWAQNLSNTKYTQVAFDAPLQAGSWNAFLAPPRTYGITLRLKY